MIVNVTMISVISASMGLAAGPTLNVCTNRTCKKMGSADTIELLTALASMAPTQPVEGIAAAALQKMAAQVTIGTTGCLGGCGEGPNVVVQRDEDGEIFYGVYKPAHAAALLRDELGLDVPEAAVAATLDAAYATRALRANQPDEARALLTRALNSAGKLGLSAAWYISNLLERRADLAESERDTDAAAADRTLAATMREKRAPAPAAVK